MFVPSAKPAAAPTAGSAGAPPASATASDRALPAAGSGERAATHGDDADDADTADEPRPHRSLGTVLLVAALVIGVAGVAAIVLLGYLNSDRYVLACEPDRAVPEQGRGFPPWGTRALTGAAWRPVKIAPETRCQPHETDDALVLQRVFLAMVLDQATALLTAHEVNRVDDAEALLQQALLLTRPAEHEAESLARQRGEQHQEIERLLGDVAYWRGQAKVRDALSALGDAARQFDTAVARHPHHVSDAAAWAARARTIADQLHAGSAAPTVGPVSPASPASPPPASSPGSPAPPSPASSPAVPSPAPSPAAAAASDSAGSASAPAGAAPPAELDRPPRTPPPAAPPPDAGAQAGGVLL